MWKIDKEDIQKRVDMIKTNGGPGRIWTDDHPVMSRALHQTKLRARGAADRIRTDDRPVNSRVLWPTELQRHVEGVHHFSF